ncbi:MAG TPA: hypothetical protein VK629_09775, partial [Steroidobacteraceae bacterium]|nr:hypothetical protein [Steroidobacteraceae bacterium]
TTRLFKLERLILKWAVAKPSIDDQARQVAAGDRDDFAAWTVEQRADDQLLMCDLSNRTRSWFMVGSIPGGTRLHFGSAVVPVRDPKSGRATLGGVFTALAWIPQNLFAAAA